MKTPSLCSPATTKPGGYPGDWDIYEHIYNETKFSAIDATSKRDNANLAQTSIPENAVNTPVTLKADAGYYLSFHEANLTDYSGMTLKVDKERMGFVSELVGSPDDSKVKARGALFHALADHSGGRSGRGSD
jgi:hypothetical protein